jgi:hypothetical protein
VADALDLERAGQDRHEAAVRGIDGRVER